jgi:predicted chitinase
MQQMTIENFLFENVARYATGLPQQIEWGKSLDAILARSGSITKEDIAQAALIWRGRTDAVDSMADSLKGGAAQENPTAQPVAKVVITKEQAERVFLNPIYDIELADLNNCLVRFEIDRTMARLCFFLAQIAHESGGLRWMKELDAGWYIPENFGLPAIAASDGGYKYRGAGALQLSMPENYLAFSEYMGDPKIYDLGCPYVAERYPFSSAGFWWKNNNINAKIDQGYDMYQISGIVNTGSPDGTANHMNERLDCYYRAVRVMS